MVSCIKHLLCSHKAKHSHRHRQSYHSRDKRNREENPQKLRAIEPETHSSDRYTPVTKALS